MVEVQKSFLNDTKLEPISWEPKWENSFFNFCVGVDNIENLQSNINAL